MPQSLAKVLVHLVYSTTNANPSRTNCEPSSNDTKSNTMNGMFGIETSARIYFAPSGRGGLGDAMIPGRCPGLYYLAPLGQFDRPLGPEPFALPHSSFVIRHSSLPA